ncbi:MAG: hypothetical protein ACOZNI_31515 [Myxococcota bacterium]
MTRRRLLVSLLAGGALLLPGEARAFNVGVFAGAHLTFTFDPTVHTGLGFDLATTAAPFTGASPAFGGFVRGDAIVGRGWVLTTGGRFGVAGNVFGDCLGYMHFPEVDLVIAHEWGRAGSGWRVGGFAGMVLGTVEVTSGVGEPGDRPAPMLSIGAELPVMPVCVAGRPARAPDGRLLLPRVVGEGSWVTRGRHEQSSAAEFVRIARLVHALGAPRALVGRALAAAEDEAQHALGCYAMAGRPVLAGPSPTPRVARTDRERALAALAAASVTDGVIGEEAGAATAEHAAHGARDAREHALERRIAEEERRHARLSGDLVTWCLREGGAEVRAAVREAEAC